MYGGGGDGGPFFFNQMVKCEDRIDADQITETVNEKDELAMFVEANVFFFLLKKVDKLTLKYQVFSQNKQTNKQTCHVFYDLGAPLYQL